MALLSSVTVCGCGLVASEPEIPAVATFQIDARLAANSCGYGSLPLPSYQALVGTLSGYAGENAKWKWDGQTRFSAGTGSTTGTFTFAQQTQYELITADVASGYPGCSIRRRDELVVTITPVPRRPVDAGTLDGSVDDGGATDAGTDASISDAGADAGLPGYALTGTYIIDIAPVAGGDCTPALGINGGTWMAIPCSARMDLTGTQQ